MRSAASATPDAIIRVTDGATASETAPSATLKAGDARERRQPVLACGRKRHR